MRTLDIAVGLVISLIAVASMALTDPAQTRGQADQLYKEIRLQRAIVVIVGKIGVVLLANGKISQICDSLDYYSNATILFNAVLGREQCRAPKTLVTESNLTVSFPGRLVVLEAWSTGSAA
jgi:uncharacterized membrane protein